MDGEIKHYNRQKGYGFIQTKEGEVFFHITEFQFNPSNLMIGDKVNFEVQENEKGKFAVKINK